MSARLARFLAKHANADSAESAIRPYRHQTEQTASACFELPDAPCPACGGWSFAAPSGGPWRCAACHPAIADAGWSFCALPGASSSGRGQLDYPPGWQGWPDGRQDVVYLDTALPDIASTPIARCTGCRFTAPLSDRRLCGACEAKRLLAVGQRAANPDLASDPVELMLQPGGQS